MKNKLLLFITLVFSLIILSVNASSELEGIEKEFPSLKKPQDVKKQEWQLYLYLIKKGKESNAPIQFYGKVLDQNNAPVAEMQILAIVTSFNEQLGEDFLEAHKNKKDYEELSMQTHTHKLLQSDPNGLFYIKNESGYSLSLEFLKEGYMTPDEFKVCSYKYKKEKKQSFQQKDSPEIFKVWRVSPSLPELTSNRFKMRLPDPNTYYVDLLKQKVVKKDKGYDFSLTYKIEGKGQRRYSWAVDINPENEGGISETEGIYMFRAPEKFQRNWSFEIKEKSEIWTTDIRRHFYIKSRKGKQYANILFSISIYPDGHAKVTMESAVNSSGSRNLERIPTIDREIYEESMRRKLIQWKERKLEN